MLLQEKQNVFAIAGSIPRKRTAIGLEGFKSLIISAQNNSPDVGDVKLNAAS
jgi:hypothetical protein